MNRIRAGVLERGMVELLRKAEVAERLEKEALWHEGLDIAFGGQRHRIDLADLTGGRVCVYGQTEITNNLYAARDAMGGIIVDEAEDVTPCDVASDAPYLTYKKDGRKHRLDCDFVAGCDGYYGVSRTAIPGGILKTFERVYPFGWLGLLSDTPPISEELIYINHERGFALCSQRSTTRSRCYLQCAVGEDPAEWPDERFWEELQKRLPEDALADLVTGPSIEKSAPLRSLSPNRCAMAACAGDAAHIVPPTGAKGLNLAESDIHFLSRALIAYFKQGDETGLEDYSRKASRASGRLNASPGG